MVSAGEHRLTSSRRRAVAAFLLAALYIWFRARHGTFYIIGMDGPLSHELGPLLPAFCAGVSAAFALLLVAAAAGPVAAMGGVVVLLLLPGFVPLHQASLDGPPLVALALATTAIMVHAPRFSLAYGTLAAAAAFYVSADGIGLPIAVAVWGALQPASTTRRVMRAVLALVPAVAAFALAHLTGGAWNDGVAFRWQGGLDRTIRAISNIAGDQLAPQPEHYALRYFIIADVVVILIAVVVLAWRRIARPLPYTERLRRLFPAAGIVVTALLAGIVARRLLVADVLAPGLDAVLPAIAVTAMVIVASTAVWWRRWPRWGRAFAALLIALWLQGAIRS